MARRPSFAIGALPVPMVVFVTAGFVVVIDQLSKAWALSSLAPGERRPLVGDLLGLQLTRNPGAALSIATSMTWALTIVAAVVVVVVVRTARKAASWPWALTFGLLLGGALGNLVDRLVRDPGPLRGHVVDFLAYGTWFIGNVADIAIVLAAVFVMVLVAFGVRLDGTRGEAPAAQGVHASPEASDGEQAGSPAPPAQGTASTGDDVSQASSDPPP